MTAVAITLLTKVLEKLIDQVLMWLGPSLRKPTLVKIVVVTVVIVGAALVLWQLSADQITGSKGSPGPATRTPASSRATAPANPHTSGKSPSTRQAPTERPATQSRYFQNELLRGDVATTPIAIKGNADAARNVLDALAVPLKQGLFTKYFFNEGLFDRALGGDGSRIAQLKLPDEIRHVVLLQVGEAKQSAIPDGQGAIRIKRSIAITVLEAHTGAVLKSSRFTAEGVGYDEEFAEESFKEDLATKTRTVREAL